MKKIYKIVFALMVVILLTNVSCEEDFLDRYPKDTPSSGSFFIDEESAMKTALAGMARVQFHLSAATAMRANYLKHLDVITDDLYSRTNFATYYGWAQTPTASQMWKFWVGYYGCIAASNYAIEGIPNSSDPSFDEEAQKPYIAIARFLRAWGYSKVVELWGSAPLITKVLKTRDEYYQPKSPAVDIYNQIIDDFKFAKDNLPESWPKHGGAPTKAAAAGLLAKAYLYFADYYKYEMKDASSAQTYFTQAAQLAEEAITLAGAEGIELRDQYEDFWTESNEHTNPEIIWAFQFAKNVPGFGNRMGTTAQARGVDAAFMPIYGPGWGYHLPQRVIIDEYEPDDRRKEYSVFCPGDFYGIYHGDDTSPIDYWYIDENTGDTTHTQKVYSDGDTVLYNYTWSPSGSNLRKTDFPINGLYDQEGRDLIIIRLADLYLMAAEAYAELDDGTNTLKYVDMVRARPDVNLPARALGDGRKGDGSLIDIVRHERRVELAFEGIRLFDMSRWGLLETYKQRGENHEIKRHYYWWLLPDDNEAKYDIPYGTPGPGPWPIPQSEIDQNDAMTEADQNPGY